VARQFPNRPEIVKTPRASPVTHRHYDIINLVKAFPDYKFIALEEGIARCQRESLG